jgi:hypothetical protein
MTMILLRLAVVVLLVAGAFSSAQGDECCQGKSKSLKDQVTAIADSLATNPECIEFSGDFGKEPEQKLNQLTAHLSESEIAARLILAETIASGCASPDVVRGLANVVSNRVKANSNLYGQGVRGVVFKKYQFRSSTGGCDVARRDVFLCPSKALSPDQKTNLWNESLKAFSQAQSDPL